MRLWPSRLAPPASLRWPIAHLLAALCGTTLGIAATAADHPYRVAYRTTAAPSRTAASASAAGRHVEEAAYRPLSFGVVANLPPSPDQAPRAQALLQWIGTEGKVAFVLDLGNFKTASEPCSDALFAARYALLNSSPVPLVYVPGQNDWADCAQSSGGATDPIERLDAIRDVFLSGPMSLGTSPMQLIRQSELPAFRPYRENTRWIQAGVVFASLNVPGDNNHFYDGGGRNGEYEDREIANRTWIARAVTDARRRRARGLVFFFEGDPHFPREIRSGFSRWLTRLSGRREPDGFAALRRDLIAASRNFDGPVLVLYADRAAKPAHVSRPPRQSSATAADGVVIESILHESNGDTVHRLKRIEVGMPLRLDRWLRVAMPASRASEGDALGVKEMGVPRNDAPLAAPTFRFTMEKVPADLPAARPSPEKTGYASGGAMLKGGSALPSGDTGPSPNPYASPSLSSSKDPGSSSDTSGDLSSDHGSGGNMPGNHPASNVKGPFQSPAALSPSTPGGAAGSPASGGGSVSVAPGDGNAGTPPRYDQWKGEPAEPAAGGDPNSSALGNISTPVLLPLPPLDSTPSAVSASPARASSGVGSGTGPAPAADASDAASTSK